MLHLNYKYRWVVSFCALLATNRIAVAKEEKTMATLLPTIGKNSADKTKTTDKAKSDLQSELEMENALNRARLEKKLSAIIAQIEELRLEKERKRLHKEIEDESVREAHDKAMRLLSMEKEKLVIELELAQAKFAKQMEQYNIQIAELDKKTQLEKGQTQLIQETSHRLQAEIEALQAKLTRAKHIQRKPIYLKDPFIKGDNVLVLSDRCIELDGCIGPWTANYIVDRIQYFNNKSRHYPIFIIIGSSPGGSVRAGWNILQAIKHSKAPVYVVVQEFAASMAAIITTLATKSYAYPNAIILHHQPFYFGFFQDNVRGIKERYEDLTKVWERLGGRVAKKMGISLKDFDKKLYEKSMDGDWREYGDGAKKLKWVDFVVNSIQDTAISSLPDAADYTLEKYIKKYYGSDGEKGKVLSAEEAHYYALTPHDFDYSYRPDRKAQMMGKK